MDNPLRCVLGLDFFFAGVDVVLRVEVLLFGVLFFVEVRRLVLVRVVFDLERRAGAFATIGFPDHQIENSALSKKR